MKTIYFLFVCMLFSSCAQISSFQTARTTPKEEGEFGASVDITGVSDLFDTGESFGVPSISLWGRYGVGEKTDLGFKISSLLNLMFDVKQQIAGDQNSKFAFALGAGLGFFPAGKLVWQYHLPVYLSFHPSERFAWYLTPRYINQYKVNYLGSSIGFMVGRKAKFAMELSLSQAMNDLDTQDDLNLGASLFNIGWGIKVPIK